jgi:Ca-activated chloride channel family protein
MNWQHPQALWLLVPAAILVTLSLVRAPKGARSAGILNVSLRLAIIASLIFALAAPYSTERRPLHTITALLDISGSLTEPQGEELLQKALALSQQLSVPLSVVPFGGSAVPRAVKVSSADSFRSLRAAWQRLDTGRSDIAGALQGRATVGAPFLLLLTDGYETVGSAREALKSLLPRPIFPLSSVGEEGVTTLAISQLDAPRSVPAQRSAEIRTTVTSRGFRELAANLEVRHADTVVLTRSLRVAPSTDISVVAQSNPELEGLHPIQARLSWRDDEGQHTLTRTTWMSGEKRDKVLLISGSAEDDRFLSQILKSQAYQLRSVVVGSADDTKALTASEYEAIVLNNVAVNRIPARIASEVRSYVRGGGGLVVVGGGSSYGLGGYIGSSLEEILPVKLLPPQPEKKRLTIAVQLVVDKSRSMATDNRLEFAKAAAEEVVRNLKDDDFIGVIGFDEVPFIALPVSRLSQVRDSAISRISRLFPTSRTNLFPALDEARRGLAATPAGRKHVIVLTDGKLPDPGPYYFDLIRQMRFVGITVSTVMVGNEVDDGFLAQMAQAGGGAFYQTNDPANLPKVFLSDVNVASGERTLREEAEMSVRPGPDPIVSTGLQTYPALRGFVLTAEREKAQTELLVRDTEGSHPLLASWNVGEGRVVAFTSDANGRWSSNWMRWERIQEFWSDLIDSSRRRDTERAPNRVEFDLRTWVESSDVILDLALFAEIGRQTIHGDVTRPDGTTSVVEFTAEKPGHYRARLPRATAGTFRAKIGLGGPSVDTKKAGSQELPEVAWEVDGSQFGERPHRSPDLALLSEVARMTGGVVDPNPADLQAHMQQESEKKPYVHELLSLALGLLLLEFALRMFRGRFKIAG